MDRLPLSARCLEKIISKMEVITVQLFQGWNLKNTIALVGIAAAVIMGLLLVKYKVSTAKYRPVEAVIQSGSTTDTLNRSDNTYSYFHQVTYTYNIEGKEYHSTQQVFRFRQSDVGKHVTVRYDVNDPQKLYSKFYAGSLLGLCLFFAVFGIGLFFADPAR